MRPIGILVTGDPVPSTHATRGDFSELMRARIGGAYRDYSVVDARSARSLPRPSELAGLIITGSPSSVTERQEWMLAAEAYLRDLVTTGLPVLGVCFGHQLLAQALGGRVARNPRGREIGTVVFSLEEPGDPVVGDARRPYEVNMSHVDTVVEKPPGASVLGQTERDPCAALRFGEWTWGVQFHPEFDRQIVGQYAMTRADALREEGLDPEQVTDAATEAPAGAGVLTRFVELVRSREREPGR